MVLSIIQLDGKPVPDQTPNQQPPRASIPFKGYKTVYAVMTFLITILSSPDAQQIISQYPKSFATGVSIFILAMRAISNTAIFSNQPITPTKE